MAGPSARSLGGLLTTFDWRLVFAINLPVCVAMLVLLRHVAASPRRPRPVRLGRSDPGRRRPWRALIYGLIDGGADGFGVPVGDHRPG